MIVTVRLWFRRLIVWGASTVLTSATRERGTEPPVWVGIMTERRASRLADERLSPLTLTVISSPSTLSRVALWPDSSPRTA